MPSKKGEGEGRPVVALSAGGRLYSVEGAFRDDRVNDVLNTDRVFLVRAR